MSREGRVGGKRRRRGRGGAVLLHRGARVLLCGPLRRGRRLLGRLGAVVGGVPRFEVIAVVGGGGGGAAAEEVGAGGFLAAVEAAEGEGEDDEGDAADGDAEGDAEFLLAAEAGGLVFGRGWGAGSRGRGC